MKKPPYEVQHCTAAALAYAKISDWARVSHQLLEIEQRKGKIERTKRARTIHDLLENGGELAAPTKELWNKLLMRNASPETLARKQLNNSGDSGYPHALLPRKSKSAAQAKPLQLSSGGGSSSTSATKRQQYTKRATPVTAATIRHRLKTTSTSTADAVSTTASSTTTADTDSAIDSSSNTGSERKWNELLSKAQQQP
eukprot:1591-Heterococcus_DN1.PRE.3